MDASEVTRRIRERTIYANYLAQKNRIDGGCGSSIRLSNNGSGSFESSLIPALREGELFTTPEQRDAILADSSCNVVQTRDAIYMVGQFYVNPISFFAAQEEFAIDLNRDNTTDGFSTFLVKFNLSGTPLWATRIQGVYIDMSGISSSRYPSIHVSSTSTIYVTGATNFGSDSHAMYFYDSNGVTPSISIPVISPNAQWIAEYNSEGQVQWATYLGSEGSFNRTFLTSDSNHNVYLQLYTSISFDIYHASDYSTSVQTVNNVSNTATIIVKYDTNGQYLWHSILSGTDGVYIASLVCDHENNVYAAITCQGDDTIDIYGPPSYGSPSFSIVGSESGHQQHVIIKYSSTGEVLWGTKFTGTENGGRVKMVVDSSNNLYLYGMYQSGSLDIYSQNDLVTPTFTLANSSQTDTFFVKFTSSGVATWASRILGTGNEQQPSLGIDSSDNLYLVGETTSDSLDVYDAESITPSRTLTFNSIVGTKIYIIKFNTSGISQWSSFIGPFSITTLRNDMKAHADGTFYITGLIPDGDTINFYDTDGNTPISAMSNTSGNLFIFLVKYDSNGAPVWKLNTNTGDLPQLSV